VFTFLYHGYEVLRGASPTAFMAFFIYVWTLWGAKALLARRYRPASGDPGPLPTTVIVPVFSESESLFRRVLESVRANDPSELIAVIDGSHPYLAAIAEQYCDLVLRIPRSGKREAIRAGFEASDPATDVLVVVDSDTVW